MTPCQAAEAERLLAAAAGGGWGQPRRYSPPRGGAGGHVTDVTPPPEPDPGTGRHPVSHYTKDGTLYLKTFLIDDKRNRNKWRASWDSIKKNARTFIGRPGIEYTRCGKHGCLLDHTDGTSFDDNLHIQEKYRRTTIVDVILDESSHTAYAIHRVDSKEFADKIRRGEIQWLSPSIWPNEEKTTLMVTEKNELFIDTTGWKGIHDAFVTRPAFGTKARIVAQCTDHGDGAACMNRLRDPGAAASLTGTALTALVAVELAAAIQAGGPE